MGGLLLWILRKHKWQLIIYAALITAFTGAMAAATPETQPKALALAFMSSLQAGTLGNAAISLTPLCLNDEDIGLALGLIGTSRAVFSAIGQAIFIAILNSEVSNNIPKYVVPAAIQAGLPSPEIPALIQGLSTGNLTGITDITPSITAASEISYKIAYAHSFKVVYLSSIAFGICAVAAAFLVPDLEKNFTTNVARRLHDKKNGETPKLEYG